MSPLDPFAQDPPPPSQTVAPPPPDEPPLLPPPGTGTAAGPGASSAAPPEGSTPRRRSEWRRAEQARRHAARNSVRFPILTRSVLLWMLVFALVGVAFGASGAFWWAHFNSQVSQLRSDTQDFETRSQSASADIEKQRTDAVDQINAALKPLRGFLSEAQTIQLAQAFSPSVYTVATLDDQGRPAVGTAFSVVTNDHESLMLTSYSAIKAATVKPGPDVVLRKGTEEIKADVYNWDPQHDMALLHVDKGNITVLDWASDDVLAKALGQRVFAVGGTGGSGATLTAGMVIDQSQAGFQYTAPLGADFRGGPVVDADGKVMGLASLDYSPLGYDNGQIHFAPPISNACAKVLTCGGGTRAQGSQGG